jgi:hypothetical protein
VQLALAPGQPSTADGAAEELADEGNDQVELERRERLKRLRRMSLGFRKHNLKPRKDNAHGS